MTSAKATSQLKKGQGEDRGSGRLTLIHPAEESSDDEASEHVAFNSSRLRMIVIGSRQAVIDNIRTLHRLNYAHITDWSRLLPGPNPGEFMSVLTIRSTHLQQR